jgi:SAM-dependent methyltransferase
VKPTSRKAGATSLGAPSGHHHGGLERRAWTREEALDRLESPERRISQDPEVLWSRVGLARGETVVDIGAGTGYFAIPAARRVGPVGRVYAVDLSADLVELIRERAERESLPQLEPVLCTLSSIPLPSKVADVVLLANVLHDVPDSTLSEAARLLKPTGRFINVDWAKRETPGGPPMEIRLDLDHAERRLAQHGLVPVERWSFGPWHYGITLRLGGRTTGLSEGPKRRRSPPGGVRAGLVSPGDRRSRSS